MQSSIYTPPESTPAGTGDSSSSHLVGSRAVHVSDAATLNVDTPQAVLYERKYPDETSSPQRYQRSTSTLQIEHARHQRPSDTESSGTPLLLRLPLFNHASSFTSVSSVTSRSSARSDTDTPSTKLARHEDMVERFQARRLKRNMSASLTEDDIDRTLRDLRFTMDNSSGNASENHTPTCRLQSRSLTANWMRLEHVRLGTLNKSARETRASGEVGPTSNDAKPIVSQRGLHNPETGYQQHPQHEITHARRRDLSHAGRFSLHRRLQRWKRGVYRTMQQCAQNVLTHSSHSPSQRSHTTASSSPCSWSTSLATRWR